MSKKYLFPDNKPVISRTFAVVANGLMAIGRRTGLIYNEVNILVYYLLIPLSWAVMFDVWLGLPVATALVLIVWAGIFVAKRHNFSTWCDRAFMRSVDFLNWFNHWGGNYVLNSVIICVIIPLIIYGLLIWLLII